LVVVVKRIPVCPVSYNSETLNQNVHSKETRAQK